MSTNTTLTATHPVEQQHRHLQEVHEHLRHASTSDAPEEIRERLRRAELALQRHEQEQSKYRSRASTGAEQVTAETHLIPQEAWD